MHMDGASGDSVAARPLVGCARKTSQTHRSRHR
jgi:hypothetical protein